VNVTTQFVLSGRKLWTSDRRAQEDPRRLHTSFTTHFVLRLKKVVEALPCGEPQGTRGDFT
jgi:hypothetical protein